MKFTVLYTPTKKGRGKRLFRKSTEDVTKSSSEMTGEITSDGVQYLRGLSVGNKKSKTYV